MAKKFIDPETNEEVEAVPLAEHTKALEDKDAHVKQKLDEFQVGKNSQELKDQERDAAIAAAKKAAEDAASMAADSEKKRVATIENFALESLTGGDQELTKKIMEKIPFIALPITSDKDIIEKYRLAASLAGLGNVAVPNFGAMGGYVPNFNKQDQAVSDVDHEKFLKETGLK